MHPPKEAKILRSWKHVFKVGINTPRHAHISTNLIYTPLFFCFGVNIKTINIHNAN